VGGTLIEAGVLDEVLLAFVAHDSTVVPVEVVQVGVIIMGLLCGVGRATGIGAPWLTLLVECSLWAWCYFMVFSVHTHVELVQTQRPPRQG